MTAGSLEEAIARIATLDASDLGAILAFDPDRIRRDAADTRGDGSLAGALVAVKDNIATTGYPTTCASRMLEDYRSPFEATVVARLRAAGAVIACKTNLDEFAMGSSTEYSAFGPCRNPHDPDRVPGGSSGGSAVAVASGAVRMALGSDTGGSIRQPAAFCGVVGFKPTYGRVSRYGLVAFASSLDQIGAFGRTVDDVAALTRVISGPDPRDSTSLDLPPIALRARTIEGAVIGVPPDDGTGGLDPGVHTAFSRAVRDLEDAGAIIRPAALPHADRAVPAYYVIATAEASANLARFDGVRYGRRARDRGDIRAMYRATRGAGFGPEVRRRILVGTWVLSAGYYDAYYGRAVRARAAVAADFAARFAEGLDAILTPTTPTPAFPLGACLHDPVTMYKADLFVCGVNLAGLPAISLPIGRTGGLPVGAQLIGPAGGDEALLGLARSAAGVFDAGGEV